MSLSFIAILQYSQITTETPGENDLIRISRFAAFGLLFFFFSFLKFNKYLELKYRVVEWGIMYREKSGRNAAEWKEITGIYINITRNYLAGIFTGYSRMIVLEGDDRLNLVITDEFENADELIRKIRNRVTTDNYKRIANEFNDGAEVEFGNVKISRSRGILINGKRISWDEIGEVEERKGIIKIKDIEGKTTNRGRLRVVNTPNVEVFLSLVDQIVSVSKK